MVDGDNYGCIYSAENQKRIKYLKNKGHQLASHTWEHSDLTTLSWDELHDTFWKTEQALQRIAGVVPAFMRPPYGNTNSLVQEVARVRGQGVVIWDLEYVFLPSFSFPILTALGIVVQVTASEHP